MTTTAITSHVGLLQLCSTTRLAESRTEESTAVLPSVEVFGQHCATAKLITSMRRSAITAIVTGSARSTTAIRASLRGLAIRTTAEKGASTGFVLPTTARSPMATAGVAYTSRVVQGLASQAAVMPSPVYKRCIGSRGEMRLSRPFGLTVTANFTATTVIAGSQAIRTLAQQKGNKRGTQSAAMTPFVPFSPARRFPFCPSA